MAKHNKWLKTLFFIAGSAATEAEIEASAEFEPGVQFRNAAFSKPNESIEKFDRLAGLVPEHYQAALAEKEGRAAEIDEAKEPKPDPAKVPKEAPVKPPTPNANAGWTANT